MIPCKNCLVKASCRVKCKKMTSFEESFIGASICFGTIILMIVFIYIFYLLFVYLNKYVAWTLTLSIIISSYASSYHTLFEGYNFKDEKIWSIILILLTAPALFVSGCTYSKIDDKIDKLIFRHNMKIAPSYLRKTNE